VLTNSQASEASPLRSVQDARGREAGSEDVIEEPECQYGMGKEIGMSSSRHRRDPVPPGPWVYFPIDDWSAVTQEIVKVYPPGTAHWGTNQSKWKRGHWYVHGENRIPMETIVRRTVRDEKSVEVLPFEEGAALECEPIID
jgi:hypothetical protein